MPIDKNIKCSHNLTLKFRHTELKKYLSWLFKTSQNLIHIALLIVTSHMECGSENNVPTTDKRPTKMILCNTNIPTTVVP